MKKRIYLFVLAMVFIFALSPMTVAAEITSSQTNSRRQLNIIHAGGSSSSIINNNDELVVISYSRSRAASTRNTGFYNVAGFMYEWVVRNDGTVWYRAAEPTPQRITEITTDDGIISMDEIVAATWGYLLQSDGTLWARWGTWDEETEEVNYGIARFMENVVAVSEEVSRAVAILEDGSLWSWDNLGVSVSSPQNFPNPIRFMDGVVNASANWWGIVAIDRDSVLWQFGSPFESTFDYNAAPARIMDNVAYAVAGRTHVTALRTDGSLWSWGQNWAGQMGDGTRTITEWEAEPLGISLVNNDRPNPIRIMEDVAAVAKWCLLGDGHGHVTIVLRADGSVWGWGSELAYTTAIFDDEGLVTFVNRDDHLNPLRITGGIRLLDATILEPTPAPYLVPVVTTVPNLTTASAWAHDDIAQAFELGLIPHELQNNYTENATRMEFAAFAVALYETVTDRSISGRMEFNDTNDINVQKMGYLGVVTGVGGGSFAPNNGITREQAAVMLARLADVIGQPLEQNAPVFTDNAQISSWATEAVGQTQAAGIMGGVGDSRFDPQGDYTREQSIVTILRLFDVLN